MTTLPERLRASAQAMRSLHPYNEYQTVKMLDIADSARIARELEEAAQALEAQREDRHEVLRILYEAHRKTNPSPSLAAISAAIQHLQAVEDAPSAQVAQEGECGKDTKLRTPRMLTSEELAECCGGCRTNSAIETWMQRAIAKFCEVNGITFPRGVPASEYLAKVEADPRRAAALQRARDRAAGVEGGGDAR